MPEDPEDESVPWSEMVGGTEDGGCCFDVCFFFKKNMRILGLTKVFGNDFFLGSLSKFCLVFLR